MLERVRQSPRRTTLGLASEAEVQQVLGVVRQAASLRRVLLKPFFSDFGHNQNSPMAVGFVTRVQASQALSRLGIELTVADVRVLGDKYDTKKDGTFNYDAFCEDADPHTMQQGKGFHPFTLKPLSDLDDVDHYGKHTPSTVRADDRSREWKFPGGVKAAPQQTTMERIRSNTFKNGVRVREFLRDHDKLRTGAITATQFLSGLDMAFSSMSLNLTAEERESLVANYRKDMRGKEGMVAWMTFCDDVNEVFTQATLERKSMSVPATASGYSVGKAESTNTHKMPLWDHATWTRAAADSHALTAKENDAVNEALARIGNFCATRGVETRPVFDDFANQQNSAMLLHGITRHQFQQACVMLDLPLNKVGGRRNYDDGEANMLDLLSRKYDDGEGCVLYRKFCDDIAPFDDRLHPYTLMPLASMSQSAPFGHLMVHTEKMNDITHGKQMVPTLRANTDVDTLVERLRRLSKVNRIRTREYFQQFDNLRSGKCTGTHFGIALRQTFDRYGLVMGPVDLQALIDRFMVESPVPHNPANDSTCHPVYVDWSALCDVLDAVHTTAHLEKISPNTPIAKPSVIEQSKQSLFNHPATTNLSQVPSSPRTEGRVAQLLDEIRRVCRTRRVLVKPFFKDMSRHKNSPLMEGCCTAVQFNQCLSRLGLDMLTAQDMDTLSRAYDLNADGAVHFVGFASDVDGDEGTGERVHPYTLQPLSDMSVNDHFGHVQPWTAMADNVSASRGCGSRSPVRGSVNDVDVGEIMARVRQAAHTHHIHAHTHFKDYDPLNSGLITAAEFERGFNIAFDRKNINCSPLDLAAMTKRYTRDARGKPGQVGWMAFCNDVEAVFAQTGLEYDPSSPLRKVEGAPPLKFSLQNHASKEAVVELSRKTAYSSKSYSDKQLSDCMAKLSNQVATKRIMLKPFFKDFANNKNSPLMLNHVTQNQFVQVLARLSLKLSNAEMSMLADAFDDSNDRSVNYVNFCSQVDHPADGYTMTEYTKKAPVHPFSLQPLKDMGSTVHFGYMMPHQYQADSVKQDQDNYTAAEKARFLQKA